MANALPESVIDQEHSQYARTSVLKKIKAHAYPLSSLHSRDFERLMYYLFKSRQEFRGLNYDHLWLMSGTKDQGRDIVVRNGSNTVAVIQCKKYSNKINGNQLLVEVLGFVLQNFESGFIGDGVKIKYYVATLKGLTEPAKVIVDQINNQNYAQFEDEQKKALDQIEKTRALRSFDPQSKTSDKLRLSLSELEIIVLDEEDIEEMLDADASTSAKFFQLDKVIDVAAFDALMNQREAKVLKDLSMLSGVERKLESTDRVLSEAFKLMKSSADELLEEYQDNIAFYSEHRSHHSGMMLRIISSLIELDSFTNADELFVLMSAAYLTDIGLCQPIYELNETRVRLNHGDLSASFVHEFGTTVLQIPEKYVTPIATSIRGTSGILAHPEKRLQFETNFAVESFGINKLNLLFIAATVWLADKIDLQNITAHSLLDRYQDYPGHGFSLNTWNTSDFQFNSDTVGDGLVLRAASSFDDQLIFIGLHRKIEELTTITETTNFIAYKERRSLKIKFIKNELQSVFKRRIGITVDANKILNTLLGKKLYAKELDAVREVIQNAFDACTIDKVENGISLHRIDVEYTNGNLTIRDNGIGMDEEIIRNYFAKVGRSYHTELQNNLAIGKFGIGVFSYFMLAKSFIVETKKSSNVPLKFKVDENSSEMFYFFETPQEAVGTTVVFDSLDFKVSDNDLSEYVSHTFKFCTIPLYLNNRLSNAKSVVDLTDVPSLVDQHVKIEHRADFKENFELSIVEYDDADMEGWIGVFAPKTNNFVDFRQRFARGLQQYNKGVFVAGSSTLIGEVNYKKGFALRLDRNSFEQTPEYDELHDQTLAQLFRASFGKCMIQPQLFTYFFLHNYGGGHKDHSKFYVVDDILYPFAFENGITLLTNLKSLRKGDKPIELRSVHNIGRIPIDRSLRSNAVVIPIVHIYTDKFYISYFQSTGFQETVVHDHESSYLRYEPGTAMAKADIPKTLGIQQCEFAVFDNEATLCTCVGHYTYYNLKNSLIKFYVSTDGNEKQDIVRKSLKQMLHELGSVTMNAFSEWNGQRYTARVLLFDTRLQEILKDQDFSYSISKASFPVWMHNLIA